MGLLKHLLFWPVTGPTFLTRFSMEKVLETARDQLTDTTPVREDLLSLQMEFEVGQISEEEFLRREQGLMRRFREVREWQERFGMAVRGGPVRVASDQE